MDGYQHRGYKRYVEGSRRTAEIVSAILGQWLQSQTVLDIGCGAGAWMDAFRDSGCSVVHGIDGAWSPLANRSSDFRMLDFENDDPKIWTSKRQLQSYDLAVSLEVAEHISPHLAEKFIAFLASASDTILFSAAIPLQGGQHHVNENWPDYWISKFRAHGFVPYDVLRLALWNETEIPAWYRQNMLLFFRDEIPPVVRLEGERLALQALLTPRAMVHPEFYLRRLGRVLMAVFRPHRFLAMLAREHRSGRRETSKWN